MSKTKTFTEIKCPRCGNTDVSKMEYVEDCLSVRTLSFRDGTLFYSDTSTEYPEYADNERLCCKVCNRDFPIPEDMPVSMEENL